MRITGNIMAMNTHRSYGKANKKISLSAERLSSGCRINRAADDAAGLAISEKMRAQIRGLNMAARNTQDGISLIQTAEGALAEAHSILQRMNELAVQAASDTNEDFDRGQLDKEFQQLKGELDDIAMTTNFNNITLLDGSLSVGGPAGKNAYPAAASAAVPLSGVSNTVQAAFLAAPAALAAPVSGESPPESLTTVYVDLNDLAASGHTLTGGRLNLDGAYNYVLSGDTTSAGYDIIFSGNNGKGTLVITEGTKINGTLDIRLAGREGTCINNGEVKSVHLSVYESFFENGTTGKVSGGQISTGLGNAHIINKGTISVTSIGLFGGSSLENSGAIMVKNAEGSGLLRLIDDMTFVNTGTIEANKIELWYRTKTTNMGTLSATSTIDLMGLGVAYLENSGTLNGTITMRGDAHISNTAGGTIGGAVSVTESSTLENRGAANGKVTVTGNGKLYTSAGIAQLENSSSFKTMYIAAPDITNVPIFQPLDPGDKLPPKTSAGSLSFTSAMGNGTASGSLLIEQLIGGGTWVAVSDADYGNREVLAGETYRMSVVYDTTSYYDSKGIVMDTFTPDLYDVTTGGEQIAPTVSVEEKEVRYTTVVPVTGTPDPERFTIIDISLLHENQPLMITKSGNYRIIGQAKSGVSVSISYDVAGKIEIDSGAVLNDFSAGSNDIAVVNDGAIKGVVDIYGEFVNNGSIESLYIAIGPDSTFTNSADATINVTGNFMNYGTAFNYGKITGDVVHSYYTPDRNFINAGEIDGNVKVYSWGDFHSIFVNDGTIKQNVEIGEDMAPFDYGLMLNNGTVEGTITKRGSKEAVIFADSVDFGFDALPKLEAGEPITAPSAAEITLKYSISGVDMQKTLTGRWTVEEYTGGRWTEVAADGSARAKSGTQYRYTLEFEDGGAGGNVTVGADPTNPALVGYPRAEVKEGQVAPVVSLKNAGKTLVYEMTFSTSGAVPQPEPNHERSRGSAPLVLQVGATAGDMLTINIEGVSAMHLGLLDEDLSTIESSGRAITAVRGAIGKVSGQRGYLGALHNRLEHKLRNLKTSSENLQAAESRIRDADISAEMAEFTKATILAQAATAMLAQANANPQNVLSLLR